jgi:uncharacterized protein (DUF2235 family)
MSAQRAVAPTQGPQPPRKTFVLLFDGTGNKFSGTDGDSNVLKILRMLDKTDASQVHYYQPGIGTYVQSATYTHTSVSQRIKSKVQKAKDQAVGTSLDLHVMGGYKFLMKYYTAGDDIYFFGFSRGAYIARFLAEMLDYVGLLEHGNEEMTRFAWKAFAQWQARTEVTEEDKEKKSQMFTYLQAFRDTFSRPVRRIRFMGLFDTVNSVPRFENAWLMRKSKFPYTAKSSALIVRQAVSIDERRAKFRQDLVGSHGAQVLEQRGRASQRQDRNASTQVDRTAIPQNIANMRFRRKGAVNQRRAVLAARQRSLSPALTSLATMPGHGGDSTQTLGRTLSVSSAIPLHDHSDCDRNHDGLDDNDDNDESLPQDIQEVWFPGGHADIGGGWPLFSGEDLPLSHGPLVWIVHEARKAGLRFDESKMLDMRAADPEVDDDDPFGPIRGGERGPDIPALMLSSPLSSTVDPDAMVQTVKSGVFRKTLNKAADSGKLHDCLEWNGGASSKNMVVMWKILENLPFRRMDLQ